MSVPALAEPFQDLHGCENKMIKQMEDTNQNITLILIYIPHKHGVLFNNLV
jgi:hypothetical protein